jgi:hypothetical protein
MRVAAFAALLAAVFAVAVVVGNAADPDTSQPAAAEAHGGATEMAHATVKGLAVTDHGYTLELADRRLKAQDTQLRFRIRTEDGTPLKDFALEHERRMHLIVVRRDNAHFQHLHPTMAADGTWTATIRFAEGGAYRVFADFKTGDTPVTLGADLTVDGPQSYRPLPAPATAADADGYQVRLDDREAPLLRFTVTKAGTPVRTEPYLGAGGHLVALRDGDLAFLHTHPSGDGLAFEAGLPTPGRYRLYLQFKVAGRVHTAAFTREVAR